MATNTAHHQQASLPQQQQQEQQPHVTSPHGTLPASHQELLQTTTEVLSRFYPAAAAGPDSDHDAPKVRKEPASTAVCEDDAGLAASQADTSCIDVARDTEAMIEACASPMSVAPAPWQYVELPFLSTTEQMRGATRHIASDDADGSTTLATLLLLLARLAAPVAATHLLRVSMSFITTVVMGHYLTTNQFAAAATGLTFTSLTAMSIGSGFCSALDTLATQEHGRRRNSPEIAAIFLRSLVCTFAVFIPMAILYAFCDPVLALLIHGDLVVDTAYFLRMSVFIATPMLLVNNLLKFAQSQRVTQLGLVGSATGTATLPVFLYVFRNGGLPGIVTALSMNRCLLLVVAVCMARHPELRQCWVGRPLSQHLSAVLTNRAALVEFVKTAIPVLGATCADTWSIEVMGVAAARLGLTSAAVWSVVMIVYSLLFGSFVGLAAAGSIRIGNSMGRGQGLLARRYAYATAVLATAVSLVCAAVLWLGSGWLFRMMQRSEEVALRCEALSPLIGIMFIFDSVFYTMQGPFRRAGYNGALLVIIVVSMFGVAVPTALILSLQLGFEEKGLFFGLISGAACVVPMQIGFLWCLLPWERQAAHTSRVPA